MLHWNDLSIRTKLASIFGGGVLFLALACSALIYFNSETVDHADQTLVHDVYALNLTLREIDHLIWTSTVGEYTLQPDAHAQKDLDVQTDGTLCAFGKWFYGDDRNKLEAMLPSVAPMLNRLEKPHRDLHQSAIKIKDLIKAGKQLEAIEIFKNNTQVNSAQVLRAMGEIRQAVVDSATEERGHFHTMALYADRITKGVLIGSVCSALIIGIFFAQNISRPLMRIADTAHAIARGALDLRLNMKRQDEAGQIARSLDSMVDSLNKKIVEADTQTQSALKNASCAESALAVAEEKEKQISTMLKTMSVISAEAFEIANKLNEEADFLAVRTEQVKAGSFSQQDKLASAATAMSQMNLVVTEIAQRAESAARSVGETQKYAQTSAAEVQQSISSIHSVNAITQLLQKDVQELGLQAESINSVMNVIADIADQTNLLALNAAIEAARAGDAGRGFAVVADEVRKLAEKTMHSTVEVGNKIQAIQQTIQSSTTNMNKATAAVENTSSQITHSGEVLRKILTIAEQNTDQVHGIATAAEEHSMGAVEIAAQIHAVADIASENASDMDNTVNTILGIAQSSHQLRSLIQRMKS